MDELNPMLRSSGGGLLGAKGGFFYCLNVLDGIAPDPPAQDTIWTYPQDGGSMPREEIAAEWPEVPTWTLRMGGSKMRSNPTGPNLFVYSNGPDTFGTCSEGGPDVDPNNCTPDQNPPTVVKSLTITGPSGPVPAKAVDPNRYRSAPVPRGGIIIVPAKPLKARARYTVSITLATDHVDGDPLSPAAKQVTKTFSFTATSAVLR